jgi:hypothetical protein
MVSACLALIDAHKNIKFMMRAKIGEIEIPNTN